MRIKLAAALFLVLSLSAPCAAQVLAKQAGAFYPPALIAKAQSNADKHPWAGEIRRKIVERAQPWMKFSDDVLWEMMFGNTIKRSWMVWSNGHCPACKKPVPMYSWRIDALKRPWKVRCPHCKEDFPKNDFRKFYVSGLDERGIFDPKLTDRSLLFNADHPNPKDPLHLFGTDDGEGFVRGRKRWRFVGTYLIYGQWKQLVVNGICNLAAAHVVTGDPRYAHKAGVLLDRVADLYPTFDFRRQGVLYEGRGSAGYVSTWHDGCEETRRLALAYDQVFDALRKDAALVAFLADKAKRHRLANPKATFADVQRNIETRIFRDALANLHKIKANYPCRPIAVLTMRTVLGWPGNRDEVRTMLDAVIDKATAVDGVTGEKGMTGYSAFTIHRLALILSQYSRIEPGFLAEMLKRHPQLARTWRFHVDTWVMQKYYPQIGDSGIFTGRDTQHVGVGFAGESVRKPVGLEPSMYTFLWKLYELTGDVAYVQTLYRANGDSVKNLPRDLFADDAPAIQKGVAEVIARKGADIKQASVNKQQWHLAILRSGQGENARAVWVDYDSGGGYHGHTDGMNLGLFAKGLNLMGDFGYRPVQYGGWGSPRSRWYKMTAAHNTVVVDGRDQAEADGKTTLWADGEAFRAVRVSAATMVPGGKQFERTVALCDVSDSDFYVLDVFRVVVGRRHDKFMHSAFGTMTTTGLSPAPAEDFGRDTQMRNFRLDPKPKSPWGADWKIDDRYKFLPEGADVHLRCTDLTGGAEAVTCEGWVSVSGFSTTAEEWIPRLITRRRAKDAGPLASTFVAVIEPYEKTSNITAVRRLRLVDRRGRAFSDANVAVEVKLADGRSDLIVAADAENPTGASPSAAKADALVQKDWDVRLSGELCFVRRGADGKVRRIALSRSQSVKVGRIMLVPKPGVDFVEIVFEKAQAYVVSGEVEDVHRLWVRGKSVPVRRR